MDMFRLLDHGFYQIFRNLGAFETLYDVKENDEELIFTMGVPGMTQEDIDLRIKDNRRLLIKSNKPTKYTPEFRYAFILPCKVDKKETYASVDKGVLEIHLKKVKSDEFKIELR